MKVLSKNHSKHLSRLRDRKSGLGPSCVCHLYSLEETSTGLDAGHSPHHCVGPHLWHVVAIEAKAVRDFDALVQFLPDASILPDSMIVLLFLVSG